MVSLAGPDPAVAARPPPVPRADTLRAANVQTSAELKGLGDPRCVQCEGTPEFGPREATPEGGKRWSGPPLQVYPPLPLLAGPISWGCLSSTASLIPGIGEADPCAKAKRQSWAELLQRTFAVDVLRCPTCGGRRHRVATLTDPLVARRILKHLRLRAEPPPLAPARPEPQLRFA